MDFIIISYLFFLSGVPVPAIAAGQDFMNMGIATGLLRGWSVSDEGGAIVSSSLTGRLREEVCDETRKNKKRV